MLPPMNDLLTKLATMKPALPLVTVILCFAGTNLNAQKTTQLPPKAEALRESYQKARARALDPIDKAYVQELRKLLAETTKSGDLDGAVAIKVELDSTSGTEQATSERAANLDADAGVLEKFVTSQRFELFYDPPNKKEITFVRSGRIGEGHNANEDTWKIKNGELYLMSSNGIPNWIFSFDNKKMKFMPSKTPHNNINKNGQLELK